jgi:hypothetical protein
MTVMMQYLWQGWNCRMPGKYKDMLMSKRSWAGRGDADAAEAQGRMQVSRLYNMTDDPGVRAMLSSTSRATPCTRTSGWPRSTSSRPTGWQATSRTR